MRKVSEVRWVREVGRPGCVPVGRPRGAKAAGVRYERALALAMPQVSHGVWLEFEDALGHGYAQVDFLWRGEGGVVVGEAKLTWRREAYVQVRKLYFPLLKWLFGSVGGILICKNVTRETPREEITNELHKALLRSRDEGVIPVLHWPLGVTG
jgi:hypothetical protein